MFNQSKEEKEFYEKQNQPSDYKKRFVFEHEREYVNRNYIEKLTDRELQEKQTYYLSQIYLSNKSIKNNVQFWFYATIISSALVILFTFK